MKIIPSQDISSNKDVLYHEGKRGVTDWIYRYFDSIIFTSVNNSEMCKYNVHKHDLGKNKREVVIRLDFYSSIDCYHPA